MTEPAAPEATAVVATRNRATRLRALLDSLAAQEGVRHEVVVVDDGSTDDTPEVVAEAARRGHVRTVRHPAPTGPATARNAGWRAGRAPLVVFVDDDCVADPGWLAAMVAAHRAAPDAVIQGRTEPHPAEVHKHSAFSRSMLVDGPNNWFQTCNIAYPRELLERLGGFDETFRHPAGEDTDLAWRAKRQGAPTRFETRARVLHAVHTLGAVRIARAARRWEDTVLCVKRYPELRADYGMRIFWKPAHQWLAFAALGPALARRTRGLSLLLALPYVTYYRSQHGSYAGTLVSMPGHVLVDGAETAAMVRGSVRYRTLVL
ncbi:MAG: glycosyltransferase [Thermoleophilaceae bacterium]